LEYLPRDYFQYRGEDETVWKIRVPKKLSNYGVMINYEKKFKKMESNWEKSATTVENYRYYEGKDDGKVKPFYSSVLLTQMSDRQEAVMVLSYIKAKHQIFKNLQPSDAQEMADIEELYSEWT
jgi:hypothetical protein